MVEDSEFCIGCGACSSVCPVQCISFGRKDGQYAPIIDKNSCIQCNKCEKVCVAHDLSSVSFNRPIASYYGYANDLEDRIESSSGGIFFAIAKKFILAGGVVVGASYNDDKSSVKHIIVSTIEGLNSVRGSKYVKSDIHCIFTEVENYLKRGIKVLFSGVPCQIGAIKMYLANKYENIFYCEIFCHGAPRSGIYESYIKWMNRKIGSITSFNFRSKKFGWSNPSYEIIGDRRVVTERHSQNLYHLMFGYHVSLRDSCYNCQFRRNERCADISLGDFWGIENFYPEVETQKGISAIIVNNKKGKQLLDNGNVTLGSCQLSEIYDKNLWFIKNYEKPDEQEEFIDNYNRLPCPIFFFKYGIQYKIIDKVRRLIGRLIT